MILFCDEDVGRRVPDALLAVGLPVDCVLYRGWLHKNDTEWLTEVDREGFLLFSHNKRTLKVPREHPRQQFSAKVGTVFEDSPLGLDKCLATMWIIANDKNGVSSYEIHREIGVTQNTAWFMLHRLRRTMHDDTADQLSGTVEADETFIGGKARNMHADRRAERITGRGASGKTLAPNVRQNVEPGSESSPTMSLRMRILRSH